MLSFSRILDRSIIELPRLIDVKLDAFPDIPENCDRLGLDENVSLLTGETTYKIAGKSVEQVLEDSGRNVSVYHVKEATLEESERIQEFYKDTSCEFSVAVGGGRVIDAAKYSSFEFKIPFVSVPTIASHDGIASARSSLRGLGYKTSYPAQSPLLVVGDIRTLSQSPQRFTVSGCADVISNKTAILDWELSNRITGEHISAYASSLAEISALSMIKARKEIAKDRVKGAYHVFKGLITSSMAMCIEGSSRPASGAEHLIAHSLEQRLETIALHGELVGAMSIFSMYLHGGDWKEIKATLEVLGAPTSATQLGIEDRVLIEAILSAQSIRPERYTILSSGVTEKAVVRALTDTGLI